MEVSQRWWYWRRDGDPGNASLSVKQCGAAPCQGSEVVEDTECHFVPQDPESDLQGSAITL